MTELTFRSKDFVYNHQHAVPFCPLEPHPDKGIGAPRLDGNLIIHGDNLHALQTLMPFYAGKVDCVFIDPPYNTGNENWRYNDNVASPMIKEWLEANGIGADDPLRHDKWCAMMWPRLRLLHELLSEEGALWMTLDDNEIHHARMLLDEIFGDDNFVACLVWRKKPGGGQDSEYIAIEHDYVLVYRKSDAFVINDKRVDVLREDYPHTINGRRCRFTPLEKWGSNQLRTDRPKLHYAITDPDGNEFFPMATTGEDGCWRSKPENFDSEHIHWRKLNSKGIHPKRAGRWQPCEVHYHDEQEATNTVKERSILYDVGSTTDATKSLSRIFGNKAFDTPKPESLIRRIVEMSTRKDSMVLDSFAGSGTTAHAVLSLNKEDGGERRFILVEMEKYADGITAERVRRVINGYGFQGKQKTELLREKITWSKLREAGKLLDAVDALEKRHGHEYDAVKKTVKNGELIVTGEKAVKDRIEGLGGAFTYCTLGDHLELEKVLSGKRLPPYESLGAALFRMAARQPIDLEKMREADSYLGESDDEHIWMIYKPDLEWLMSPEAALTLERAEAIAASDPGKQHLVIAAAPYVSRELLAEENLKVKFAHLPYALYRLDRS